MSGCEDPWGKERCMPRGRWQRKGWVASESRLKDSEGNGKEGHISLVED